MIGYEPYGPDLDAHLTSNCGQDAEALDAQAESLRADADDHAYDEWVDRQMEAGE